MENHQCYIRIYKVKSIGHVVEMSQKGVNKKKTQSFAIGVKPSMFGCHNFDTRLIPYIRWTTHIDLIFAHSHRSPTFYIILLWFPIKNRHFSYVFPWKFAKFPGNFAIPDGFDLDFLVVPYPPQRPGRRRAPVPGAAADLRVLRVGRPEAVQVDVQGDEGTLLVQILGPWEKLRKLENLVVIIFMVIYGIMGYH